jgi:hypothetical protein
MSSLREALTKALEDTGFGDTDVSEPQIAAEENLEASSHDEVVNTEAPVKSDNAAPAQSPESTQGKGRRGDDAAQPDAAEPAQEEPVKRRPPPKSWAKEKWEAWDKLDGPLADYIQQREDEYYRGVSQYKAQAQQVQPLIDAVVPHAQMLQQMGLTPQDAVARLLSAQQRLVSGDPVSKRNTLLGIAHEFGIDLTPQQGEPQFDPRDHQLQQLRAQQEQMQRQMQMRDQQAYAAAQEQDVRLDIERFAAAPGHEHFESVREDMGRLLQAGIANDLEDAYNQAVRRSDSWLEAEVARRQKAADEARQENAQQESNRARAAAVSPRSATPTGQGADTVSPPKNARDAVMQAWDRVMTNGKL